MKKFFMLLSVFLLVFGAAGVAGAIPVIDFNVAGASGGSSAAITVTDSWGWTGDPFTTLSSSLDSEAFSLGDGESETFDFFDVTVYGVFGGGEADVEATLAFDQPPSSGTGSGEGSWFTLFGILSSGNLNWTTQPTPVYLAGGDWFEIEFSDLQECGIGNTATVQATVTAHVADPVPEPATMLLLGSGLVGLAGFSRRKFKKV